MPVTTQITGTVVLPDGSAPLNGFIHFTPIGWDGPADGGVKPPAARSFPLGPAGGLVDVTLIPTTGSMREMPYRIEISHYNPATLAVERTDLGLISVPEVAEGDSVSIRSLLSDPGVIPTAPDVLAQVTAKAIEVDADRAAAQAARTATEAAAATAETDRLAAEAARIGAEAALDDVQTAAATVGTYASTAAGLSGTASGQRFWAPTGEYLQLYTNSAGSAVAVANAVLPLKAYFDGRFSDTSDPWAVTTADGFLVMRAASDATIRMNWPLRVGASVIAETAGQLRLGSLYVADAPAVTGLQFVTGDGFVLLSAANMLNTISME